MARKVKIINVDGRGEVTVKEISPRSVYLAWQQPDRVKELKALASDAITPDIEEIQGWYSSEIEAVLVAFFEVNNSFLAIARLVKMDGLLEKVMQTISKNLPGAFVDSFSQAMLTPGTTDGPPSC